jgi:hypothetical protein
MYEITGCFVCEACNGDIWKCSALVLSQRPGYGLRLPPVEFLRVPLTMTQATIASPIL